MKKKIIIGIISVIIVCSLFGYLLYVDHIRKNEIIKKELRNSILLSIKNGEKISKENVLESGFTLLDTSITKDINPSYKLQGLKELTEGVEFSFLYGIYGKEYTTKIYLENNNLYSRIEGSDKKAKLIAKNILKFYYYEDKEYNKKTTYEDRHNDEGYMYFISVDNKNNITVYSMSNKREDPNDTIWKLDYGISNDITKFYLYESMYKARKVVSIVKEDSNNNLYVLDSKIDSSTAYFYDSTLVTISKNRDIYFGNSLMDFKFKASFINLDDNNSLECILGDDNYLYSFNRTDNKVVKYTTRKVDSIYYYTEDNKSTIIVLYENEKADILNATNYNI